GAVRRHRLSVVGAGLRAGGFIPLGADGSRLQCPFSEELHRRTGQTAQEGHTCNLWVTALVHLPTGLVWSWWLGKADASERTHLERLLPTLPPQALVIADAGYQGFELASAMIRRGGDFLIRVSTQTTLHTAQATPPDAWRDGAVVLWPGRRAGRGRGAVGGAVARPGGAAAAAALVRPQPGTQGRCVAADQRVGPVPAVAGGGGVVLPNEMGK